MTHEIEYVPAKQKQSVIWQIGRNLALLWAILVAGGVFLEAHRSPHQTVDIMQSGAVLWAIYGLPLLAVAAAFRR